jgi:hypothetical protein
LQLKVHADVNNSGGTWENVQKEFFSYFVKTLLGSILHLNRFFTKLAILGVGNKLWLSVLTNGVVDTAATCRWLR